MTKVYSIPFGIPALETLAQHLHNVYSAEPHKLAETVVLLPTKRACLGLEELFKSFAPCFVPKIMALPELEAEPSALGFIPDDTEVWSKQQLICRLTKLLVSLLPQLQLFDQYKLAEELVSVIDEVETAGIPVQALKTIELETMSEYWQATRDVLGQAIDGLSHAMREAGAVTTFANKRDNLVGIARVWQQRGPACDIWLVGTTATRAGTRELARAIHTMKGGHIILTGVVDEVISSIPASHPNSTIKSFLNSLGDPTVEMIGEGASSTHRFLSHAMSSTPSGSAPAYPEHVQILEADNPTQESELIALVMRNVLEHPEQTVALITPDQDLMTRVSNQLQVWDIIPDISLGKPFSTTAVGQLFSLVASWLATPDALTLLSTLKHPLCGNTDRQAHLQAVRHYERSYLRAADHHYTWAGLRSEITQDPKLNVWVDTLAAVVLPALEAKPFADWLGAHLDIMDKLSDLPEAADTQALHELCQSLPEALEHLPSITLSEYQRIIIHAISGVSIRDVAGIGSRVKYLGVLEARLHTADVVILAGLNEGTWPQQLDAGPWLNRSMRDAVGLPAIEQRLGLAAHDFCSGFAAQQVFLTRSLQQDGAPTLASRNLRRLQLYAEETQQSAIVPYRKILALRHKTELQQPVLPEPCPPVSARPLKLSVTDVERLLKDPYAIYAKHILKLKPLEPIDRELAAVDRGNLIHMILDKYLQSLSHITEAKVEQLIELAEPFFKIIWDKPWVAQFWWPRFCQVAEWLVPICRSAEDIESVVTEIWLERALNIAGAEHTITAKVDRIDHMASDEYRIVDYKTGIAPTMVSVRQGLSPQLSLEAWLLNKDKPISLEYWQLTGGNPAGQIRRLPDADELLEQAESGVSKLLHYFRQPNTAYRACPNPGIAPAYSDYEHIERVR